MLDGARAPPVVTTNMQCREYEATSQSSTLRQLARDILANDYEPNSIVLDCEDPVAAAGKVALHMVAELFGEDMAAWNVTSMTPALWATVQAKMAATGWRLVVASERGVPGLTQWESATIPDHYLWQDQDVPPAGAEWPVYHLQPAGVFLAVAPNVGHQ